MRLDELDWFDASYHTNDALADVGLWRIIRTRAGTYHFRNWVDRIHYNDLDPCAAQAVLYYITTGAPDAPR